MELILMKRIVVCAAAAVLAWPVASVSQVVNAPSPTVQHAPRSEGQYNHGEFGVYGDYFRLTPRGASGSSNFVGLGGRVGFNVHPNIALEAEMNYDFERNYTTIGSSGASTTTVTSRLRPLTGLFGPKFQFGTSGPFRAYVTGKAGFLEFSTSNRVASGSSFTDAIDQFGNSGTHFAAYPGGGVEAFAGPFGVRVEVGDEIYMNNGANNNLRVTFAPSIRF
jgi:opacity protein-like surface antigen